MKKLKILLITAHSFNAKYATAETIRRVLNALSGFEIYWCSLQGGNIPNLKNIKGFASFADKSLHWRLRGGILESVYLGEIVARRRARRIFYHMKNFAPDLLWIMGDGQAFSTAVFLKKLLRIPIHVTLHDAPEWSARFAMNYRGFARQLHVKRASKILEEADGVDAVSSELIKHVFESIPENQFPLKIYFPPSLSGCVVKTLSPVNCFDSNTSLRRIGLCGSLRVDQQQWSSFLRLLSVVPFRFEILAFADRDHFPRSPLPDNVSLIFGNYFEDEREMLENFVQSEIHACYLGIWKNRAHELFARMSLSSKLTAYSATGIPVIVDAPEDSQGWRYVNKYDAGILLESADPEMSKNVHDKDVRKLMELFGNRDKWYKMSAGSKRLWQEEFDLDKNITRLEECFRKIAQERE